MPEAKVREPWPGVFLIPLPLPIRPSIVNVYLLRGEQEWALIDTGLSSVESIAAFRDAARAVGCELDRLAKIACTHHHPDHYGASETYKELTGAAVYLHPLEYERSQWFATRERSSEVTAFFRAHGVPIAEFVHIPTPHEFWAGLYRPAPPDVALRNGDLVVVGGRELEIVWTPGHAPGHCVLYLQREKVLFVGDHLLPKITPHVGWYPGGPEDPLGDYLESLRKIQRLDVRLVLPAHGAPFPDHRHRASQILQHHEYRMREMLDVLRGRPATAYEIAKRAFGFDIQSPLAVQFPATFETLAHLQHMMRLGRVACEERNGKVLFAARS